MPYPDDVPVIRPARAVNRHDGMIRGFSQLSRAWYGGIAIENMRHPCIDEVTFGMYGTHGGTTGEMAMRWVGLSSKPVPRLEVFDDAWDVLNNFSDVLSGMAELTNRNVTPEQFCALLLRCGFTDRTQTTR